MGTLKIQMGGYVRERILSNTDIFLPVTGETRKADLDGKPVNIKTGDAESQIEVSSDAKGRTAVFVYPLDNDPENSNGRLYVEDRFVFDPQTKTFEVDRQFRRAQGTEGLRYWDDLYQRLDQVKRDFPLKKEDPKVQKFFNEVVLSLPEPLEGEGGETPASPASSASPPSPSLLPKANLETLRPSVSSGASNEGRKKGLSENQSSPYAPTTILSRVFATAWNARARVVDQSVSRFLDGISDPIVLGSLLAGSAAFRAGEAYMLGRLGSFRGAQPAISRFLGAAMGLGLEAPAFELTGRALHRDNPHRWRWGGSQGLGFGLLRSYLTFGAFRGSQGILKPVMNGMMQQGFMPFGHSTASVFSHTGSFLTLHGVNEVERKIKLRESEGDWPVRFFADGAFYTQMIFAGGMVETILGPSPFGFVPKKSEPQAETPVPEPKAPEPPALPAVFEIHSMGGELPQEVMANLERSLPIFQRPATEHRGSFAMISTQGFGRELNEDLVLHLSHPSLGHYYVVVDGMGGPEAGEVAADLTSRAFQAEIPRSNDPALGWKVANDAIYAFNLTRRQGGTIDDAMAEANQMISNPLGDSFLPQGEIKAQPTGAIGTVIKVTPSAEAEKPSVAEFQWIGDARATVFRRDANGSWSWHYRTLDEALPYHPGVLKPGADFEPGGQGRTLAAMRHPYSAVVTNSLGGKPTVAFKSTANGEIPDPHHENGARLAAELEKGLPLEEGDLILLGSDGFWENFGHTRYIENLMQGLTRPEEILQVFSLHAHRKMAMMEQAEEAFKADDALERYDFILDGAPVWLDREGTVYDEHDQPIDHYKMDNFSLFVYLHELQKPLEAPKPPSEAPPAPAETVPSKEPEAVHEAAPEVVPDVENEITFQLLKAGAFFSASEENLPDRPRRAHESLILPGRGQVAGFTQEGLVPFAHPKFGNLPVNPDAFGFASDFEGRTFLLAAEGLGQGSEETSALAVWGLMDGFSRGAFVSPGHALQIVHPLVSQKIGGNWEGGLLMVDRDGLVEAHLEGAQKAWVLRAGAGGGFETLEAVGNQEIRLNPNDALLLLNSRVGRLLDDRAIVQAVEGAGSAEELATSLEEKAERRQKMVRDFGPALKSENQPVGPLTALVYRHLPDGSEPEPAGTARPRRILPAILLPPVPLTRAVLNPDQRLEFKVAEQGILYLGTESNYHLQPRRAEHTITIPYLGEISAMTHEGIDKHILIGERAQAVNEDAYGFFIDAKGRPVLMAADGLGGYELGDVASARAIDGAFAILGDGEASLGDAFLTAHRHIQAYNSQRQVEWDAGGRMVPQPSLARSVASAARVNIDGSVEVALVGDARLWVLRPDASGSFDVIDPYPPDSVAGNLLAMGRLANLLEMNASREPNEVAGCLGHEKEPQVVEAFGYKKFWEEHPREFQILNAFLTLPKNSGNFEDRVPFRLRKGDSLLLMSDGVADLFDPALMAETVQGQKTAEGIRTAIERKSHELLSLFQDQAWGLKGDELKELGDGRFINGRGDLFDSAGPSRRLVGHVGPDNVVALVYTHTKESPENQPPLTGGTLPSRIAQEERRNRPTPAVNLALGPVDERFLSMISEFRDQIFPQLMVSKPGPDGVQRGSYQLILRNGSYHLLSENEVTVPMDGEPLGIFNFSINRGEVESGRSQFEFTAEELMPGSIPEGITEFFRRVTERRRRR